MRLPTRNPSFAGREHLLQEVAAKLARGNVALCGLGGVGKTELALEFAHRAADAGTSRIVWWIRAEPADALNEDLLSLAAALGLATGRCSLKDVQEVVLDALRRRKDWLLVLDGAAAPGPGPLEAVLGLRQSTVVTSRVRRWGAAARSIPVPPFDPGEAVGFLLASTGSDDAGDDESTGNTADARELSAELGHLPLALGQAAAYIEAHDLSLRTYLDILRTPSARPRLLRTGPDTRQYPRSVATTWLLHLDHLRAHRPAALQFLRLSSFLHPGAVAVRDLLADPWLLPHPLSRATADALAREEMLGELTRTSLVARTGDTIRLHPLVQEAVRLDIGQEALPDWETYADQLVHALHPYPRALTDPTALIPFRIHGGHIQRMLADRHHDQLVSDRFVSLSGATVDRGPGAGRQAATVSDLQVTTECRLRLVTAFHGWRYHRTATAWLDVGIARLRSGDDSGARQALDEGFALLADLFDPQDARVLQARETVAAARADAVPPPVAAPRGERIVLVVEEDMMWESVRLDGGPATDSVYPRMIWQDVLAPTFQHSLGHTGPGRIGMQPGGGDNPGSPAEDSRVADAQRLNEVLRGPVRLALRGHRQPADLSRSRFLRPRREPGDGS